MIAKNRYNAKRGFTIVELVAVIAVIGILVAILVPTFSNAAERSRQNQLRMDLRNAYVSHRTDCGFRDEAYYDINDYIFVPKSNISYTAPTNTNTANIQIKGEGYRWNGDDKVDVTTLRSSSITPDVNTAVYGPFNGYYLLAYGKAVAPSGTGTQADPILIKSYSDLRAIGAQVSRGITFSGKYLKLTGSITIPNESWLPIGGYLSPSQPDTSGKAVFSGNFDGNGYTISVYYGRVAQDGYCLFGYTKNATISNLKVAGSIDVNGYAAGIAAKAESSTFTNCLNEATITGDHHVGGIVGLATGTTKILGCRNTGKLEALAMGNPGHNNAIGGIVGESEGSTTVQDCVNEGGILGLGGTVGGIAGIARGKVTNCVNRGEIYAQSTAAQSPSAGTDSLVGGIAGWGAGTATIDSCLNTGSVTAALRAAGGIVGADAKILNCANTGAVTAGRGYAGGIVGVVSNAGCTVNNVSNTGDISTGSSSESGPVGGIAGKLTFSGGWTLNLAVSGGTVNYRKGTAGATGQAGMLIGSAAGQVTLSNCFISRASAGVFIGNAAATSTQVGSGSTTGAVTTQANQSALCTAINAKVGSYRAWAIKPGYLGGICLPCPTYTVTYNMGSILPADRVVGLKLNTAFVGCGSVYLPYPEHTVVVNGNWQYTFQGWNVSGSTKAAGTHVTVTGDTVITAKWNKEAYTMKPIPFN